MFSFVIWRIYMDPFIFYMSDKFMAVMWLLETESSHFTCEVCQIGIVYVEDRNYFKHILR